MHSKPVDPSSNAAAAPTSDANVGASIDAPSLAVEAEEKNLDGLLLTALMSSRLCHDLVNPVGALSSGLDVLDDAGMDDEMRDEALDLIKSSTEKAVASLKYARLAYGLAGGYDYEVPFDEAKELLSAVYHWSKADLTWNVSAAAAPKEEVKALLLLVHAAADCVPRGGVVDVTGENGEYSINVTGKRVFLNDDVPKALLGDAEDLKPKHAPLYIAGLLARQQGGEAVALGSEEAVSMTLRFERPSPAENSSDLGSALTAG